MTYAIMGCITKYKVVDIKPYVESIKLSGFSGNKYMVVYDVPQETVEYLLQNGWILFSSELREHIILQRFIDVSYLSTRIDDDVIIWTDVKDVIFQSDPTVWLNKNMKSPILATSEAIVFKDEEWAVMNAGTSFPLEWLTLQDKVSYCAGTIIARREYMKDLFNEIYRWSKTTSNPQQLSDQAAFNVLINLKHFENDVQFVNQNEGLVIHMGVSWIKRDTHKNKLTELPPIVTTEGTVLTPDKEMFCIVHQYDRDTELKSIVTNKYA